MNKTYIFPKVIIIGFFLFIILFLLIGTISPPFIKDKNKVSTSKLMLSSFLITLFFLLIYIVNMSNKTSNFYPDGIKFLSSEMASRYGDVK